MRSHPAPEQSLQLWSGEWTSDAQERLTDAIPEDGRMTADHQTAACVTMCETRDASQWSGVRLRVAQSLQGAGPGLISLGARMNLWLCDARQR
jgi:hypothetical protein